jgi:hypothetical protein
MADVEQIRQATAEAISTSGPRPKISPFYSRAYAGYTLEQEQFYLSQLGAAKWKIVLDPMAGQGFLLAKLALSGAEVWLGDINPALCLLASLRDPAMIRRYKELRTWVEEVIRELPCSRDEGPPAEYVNEWLAPSIRGELQDYRELFGLTASPFNVSKRFLHQSLRTRFAAALPLLAARDIVCSRSSDNRTWTKPGGLQREMHIVGPISTALNLWAHYAQTLIDTDYSNSNLGRLFTSRMDAANGHFGDAPRADAIITSPPYANRLDYSRMWAPELEIAAAIWSGDTRLIKAGQIGSNVIRGISTNKEDEARLPKGILEVLMAIRNDAESYAAKRYYYPFFRNYAVSLARAVTRLSGQTREDGTLVVFVRDTVRKDILFPTGLLVEQILAQAGFRSLRKERQIVRRHVGLLRRGSSNGLYGLAQQEWWLSFRRGSK